MNTHLEEGWGFPRDSRKAHYFRDTMSLCRRWGFYLGRLEADEGPSPDDCVVCRRALEAEKKAAAS